MLSLNDQMGRIFNRQYQTHQDKIEQRTLENFATTVVSHDSDSIRALLWKLHDLTVPASASAFASANSNWKFHRFMQKPAQGIE